MKSYCSLKDSKGIQQGPNPGCVYLGCCYNGTLVLIEGLV